MKRWLVALPAQVATTVCPLGGAASDSDILRYHEGVVADMDILIRGMAPEDVDAVDAKASRLGLSRNQYVTRLLHADARAAAPPVTVADLESLAQTYADLGDDDVMRAAWS